MDIFLYHQAKKSLLFEMSNNILYKLKGGFNMGGWIEVFNQLVTLFIF